MDTEFSSLNPYQGEILSIDLVKMNGDGLYLELEYDGPADPWVVENIIPSLTAVKVSRKQAIEKVKEFIGNTKPYIMAYVNQYDVIYTYKLFGNVEKPFFWIPIDFGSILFGYGIDPEAYFPKDKKNFFKQIGIDASKYREHNALDDAKLLREVYLKMTT